MTQSEITDILSTLEHYVLGKRRKLEYALACMLAEGHLLIEDVPGVGKTTLAKSIAHCVHASFNRVQFTSDLLPSDLLGVTVFHQTTSTFEFKPGPIFTNVLLADEINRANPKTQGALLEAMLDGQVSHDGQTKPLPTPFFVVATQNSQDHHGTFPLPESQLDRFLMKIDLGYPSPVLEKRVIRGDYRQEFVEGQRIDLPRLRQLQNQTRAVHVADDVLDYIHEIMTSTRRHPSIRVGVSPRGGQALYRAIQALALIRGREFAIPDDVRELTPVVFSHRILLRDQGLVGMGDHETNRIISEILNGVAEPV